MLVACALLLVVDEAPAFITSSNQPLAPTKVVTNGKELSPTVIIFFIRVRQAVFQNKWVLLLGAWFLVSALTVPAVIDRALTLGVVAAIACIWIATQIGKRAANPSNGLLHWLLATWLLAALVSSVLAILQYLNIAREFAPWVNQPHMGDAFANLRQRNQFASLTSIGLVALLGMLAAERNISKRYLATAWCALALLAAGLACSVSRTGAVQWLLVFALATLWALKERKNTHRALMQLPIGAPLLVILWSLVLPWVALQLNGVMGASLLLRVAGQAQDYAPCGGRRALWTNALQMLSQHPWQGWGLGETDFAHYSTDYQSERFCDLLDNAHNLPLHLALEFGIPFALLFCVLAVHWMYKKAKLHALTNVQCIGLAMLLVLGLHSMLEYPLWYGPFQIALGLALGLFADQAQSEPVEADPFSGSRQHIFPMLVCSALFLGCLFVAWDYNRVAQIYRQPEMRDAAYRDNPMQAASQTWLFKNQVDFARLMTQSITQENAQQTYELAMRVLHYSPEPRGVERAVESLRFSGNAQEAEKLASRLPTIAPRK